MSTRDVTPLAPAATQIPTATQTPTAALPTPGAALAGARMPGGPSLPDWDPSSLAGALARLANDLCAAPFSPTGQVPAAGGAPEQPAPAPQPTVSQPAIPAQATVPAEPPVPAKPAPTFDHLGLTVSPFAAPLDWDALGGLDLPTAGAIPLLDGAPVLPADAALPYWLPPTAAPGDDLPSPRYPIAGDAYQIAPTSDLSLGPMAGAAFDPQAIRREFPILEERVNGRRLVWLDNAATTQKPQVVIDRLKYFYQHENSNVHRAAHTLAARATDAYESARESVRRFLDAPSNREIVFVRGATEGINLVAQSWGRRNVAAGDEIVITWLEHHANIVPWQQLCSDRGARLRIAPVDDRGQVVLDEYEKLLGPKTRLCAFTQVSNALGTITPAREMIEMAHRHGAKVLLDGAQAVSHMRVDLQLLDCDFFVFSGHKVFAPTGIGVLFGKQALLDDMPPWQGGGNMIEDVTFERTTYQAAPTRFEAGTGNIADAVGLGAALDWLSRVGIDNVERYEHELLVYATERLATVPGLTMIGTAPSKAGVLSFVLAGQKTEEVGGLLDKEGIAVRSGHHCAQPILRRFGLEASVRASLAPYNTCEDIDALWAALQRLQAGIRTPAPGR